MIHAPVDTPQSAPSRHRQLWEDDDFAQVMQACRDGCGIDEIAARVGRTVGGVRSQIRRLLPQGERGLPVDAVPVRLRELDGEGEYDWRKSLTARTTPSWRDIFVSPPLPLTSGIDDIPDEQLVSLVAGLAVSHFAVHPQMQRDLATAIRRRGLHEWVSARAHDGLDQSISDLLSLPSWEHRDEYGPIGRPHLAVVPDTAASTENTATPWSRSPF